MEDTWEWAALSGLTQLVSLSIFTTNDPGEQPAKAALNMQLTSLVFWHGYPDEYDSQVMGVEAIEALLEGVLFILKRLEISVTGALFPKQAVAAQAALTELHSGMNTSIPQAAEAHAVHSTSLQVLAATPFGDDETHQIDPVLTDGYSYLGWAMRGCPNVRQLRLYLGGEDDTAEWATESRALTALTGLELLLASGPWHFSEDLLSALASLTTLRQLSLVNDADSEWCSQLQRCRVGCGHSTNVTMFDCPTLDIPKQYLAARE
jgi:hypothetical protein